MLLHVCLQQLIQYNQIQNCNQKLQSKQQINYCNKAISLVSTTHQSQVISSQEQYVYHNLYTQRAQDLKINYLYQIMNLTNFYLFGLTNGIQLQNSNISVNIPQQLSSGALICFVCDVTINASDFTFVASGQNVSGVTSSPLTVVKMNQSLVQFRLNGVNVGGLILNASKIAVQISQCNISGYVGEQMISGSIICFVLEQVSLEVDSVRTCANVKNLGQGTLTQTGSITVTCIVCREGTPAYGLCQKSLEFGIVEDDKFVCPSPFVFDGEGCSCKEGDVLNGTSCINILTTVNLFNTKLIESNNSIEDLNNRTKVLENTTEYLSQVIQEQKDINQLFNQALSSAKEVIQQQEYIIEDLNLQIQCLNHGFHFQNKLCVTDYEITCSDTSLSCSQPIYIATFDITSITHQVENADNFTNGYVFPTATIIQNAFIDVSDNVYSTTVQPLFQSQSTFTNLKIQFGAQTLNSGSLILSSVQSIIINQMNIISRPGSQLSVNANSQLNILTDSPTGAVINNLLVNLSFASSSGNITLINNINGVFNVSGYQVIGNYNSTSTVAMIGLNVKMAIINVNQVRFQPSIFNVGNGSSYLFGSSIKLKNIFMINNFAVKIGSSYNFLLLGSISTNDQSNYYYQFGGIIALVHISSSVSVNNVILDSYQKFSSEDVRFSGFLIGYVESGSSNITINNMCLYQNITSTTLEFCSFGIIGINFGNISIKNAQVTFSVQGITLQSLGLVGNQANSLYAEVVNLRTSVSLSSDDGTFIGQIFGKEGSKNCSIQNISVVSGMIKAFNQYSQQIGGLIGGQYSYNATVLNSSILNLNISNGYLIGGIIGLISDGVNSTILDTSLLNINIFGLNMIGGIVGWCRSQLYLTNVQINFARLSGSDLSVGIVVGQDYGTYSFTNSIARSNFINDIEQAECANLSNTWSVTGC
ncbi:Hypothetical_protein [Hexamita inflata]|uniref:Hypothetical_protein n=1 Tax=Hexamita inflata TaxID=28002 RepID=A0AA86UY95_9EUKA|nr:Hypothetical protein HINF_LOCUS40293 [Hexamita inflata]